MVHSFPTRRSSDLRPETEASSTILPVGGTRWWQPRVPSITSRTEPALLKHCSSPVRHCRASREQCLRSAGKFCQKIQKNRFYYTVCTQNIQEGILFSGRFKDFLYAPGFSSIHFSKASGSQAKRCVDLHSKALGAVAFSQPSRNIPRIFIHALPGKSASFIL